MKAKKELIKLFTGDSDYERYINVSGETAFRKCFEVGQSVFAFEIQTKGIVTIAKNGDYYVELSDGHGGWFNYKELEKQ